MEIRNIAIIAHVDHGKTTLTDALMKQNGGLQDENISMDSNALEKERGITIYSKNTSIAYKGTKINIVDTPGHADFGSEGERVLRSIDSVLLVVDAQEGPMPQTRFVLKKSLELGLKPIVIVNKIDKAAADPAQCVEQVFELFLELGANDEQANFPVVYANGREGIAKLKLADESKDLTPLLDTILSHVKSASSDELSARPLRFQPFNLAYDNFLGRLAVGRAVEGVIKQNENVFIKKPNGEERSGKLAKIFTFRGLERVETAEASAGDVVLVAGLPDIYIGETITTDSKAEPLPAIAIDEPTIALNFLVNNSPFAGREGRIIHQKIERYRRFVNRYRRQGLGLGIGGYRLSYVYVGKSGHENNVSGACFRGLNSLQPSESENFGKLAGSLFAVRFFYKNIFVLFDNSLNRAPNRQTPQKIIIREIERLESERTRRKLVGRSRFDVRKYRIQKRCQVF